MPAIAEFLNVLPKLSIPHPFAWMYRDCREVTPEEIEHLLRTILDAPGGFIQVEEVEDLFDIDVVLEVKSQKLIRWHVANWNTCHMITMRKAGYVLMGVTPPLPRWKKALNLYRRLSGKQA